MDVHKRYAVAMRNAEEADARAHKRPRVDSSTSASASAMEGGQLMSRRQAQKLHEYIDLRPFPTGSWNPEPEILYVNAWLSGGLAVSPTGDPQTAYQVAIINRHYDKVILQRPCDYRLAITRAQLPLTAVPLFMYPLGSCTLAVGTVIPVSYPTVGHYFFNSATVTPISIDPSSDIAVGDKNYPNGAIAIWSVQQLVDAVNSAIQTAFNAYVVRFRTAVGGVAPQLIPFVSWDPSSQRFSISFEGQQWYGGPDYKHYATSPPLASALPAPPAYVWPLAYPYRTNYLFFSSTLAQTYFPTLPQEWTHTWTFAATASPAASQTVVLGASNSGTDICMRLQGQLDDGPPTPAGGPPMPLVDNGTNTVSWPTYSFITRTLRAAGPPVVNLVTWVNPPIPHGVRYGDTVTVSGCKIDPTLNRVYTIESVDDTNLSTQTAFTANTAIPRSLAWSWQAVDPLDDASKGSLAVKYGPDTDGKGVGITADPDIQMVAAFPSLPMGALSRVESEVMAMYNWTDGVMAIRLASFSIPVRQQIVPATTNVSGLDTRPILVDDVTSIPRNSLGPRDGLLYSPPPDCYAWVELIGEEPMYTWNLTATWVDQFGTEFPIYIAPGELFEVKTILQRKDVFTRASC